MPVKPSIDVQMEFSGAGGGWTSVIGDVSAAVPIRASYGIHGNTPYDRIATTGTLTFALDNSHLNSGGVAGYYSPGHASVRSGFAIGIRCRLAITYSGTTYYKFFGTVDSIQPTGGKRGRRLTYVTVLDWFDELMKSRSRRVGQPTQTSKRADELISLLVAITVREPVASSYDVASQEFPYALDTALDERGAIASEITKAVMSDLGFLVIRGNTTTGGVLNFIDRRSWQNAGAALTTLSDTMAELSVGRTRRLLYNTVNVTVHPRRVDEDTVVLVTLDTSGLPALAPSESVTVTGYFKDPEQQAVRVGAASTVTPVSGTDYTFGTSFGATNLNASLDVSVDVSSNSVEVAFTNNHASLTGYVGSFQLRGIGIYDYAPITVRVSDNTSQTAYGENILDLDLPHEYSRDFADQATDYFLAKYKDPRDVADSVGFPANYSDALMTAALAREPGDVIALTETQTGLSADRYFIQKVRLELSAPNIVWCEWGLAPQIDTDQYWQLDISQLEGDTNPTLLAL